MTLTAGVSSTVRRLDSLLRSPTFYSLTFQAVSGLIQIAAFFSLHGPSYLAFSAAFLLGNVLSLGIILNFENVVLAGGVTASVRRYFVVCWILGLASAFVSMAWRPTVPSFVTFCCWGVCLRLFLAWANRARPSPLFLILSVLPPVAACAFGNLSQLMAAVLLMMPVAAHGASAPTDGPDSGFRAVGLDSLRAFLQYLPHTVSGLIVGYVDRYAALQIVGGSGAETYLRTLQVCSWGAFLVYPAVFHLRREVLQRGNLRARLALRVLVVLLGCLAAAVAGILLVLHWAGKMPAIAPAVIALTFLGITCSQCYQVVSSLNFVGRYFGTINRITLTSAAVALALAFSIVPATRSPVSLAVVLFIGWAIQFTLTARSLLTRNSSTAT